LRLVKHLAIIMDGNRRWAKKKGLPPAVGHWNGAETLTQIVEASSKLGIETLTVYAFSTENWSRSSLEVDSLMKLFELYLINKRESMVQDGVRLHAIGDLEKLPEPVLKALNESKKATEKCRKINLVLAINYGGRDAIRRAIAKMLEKRIQPQDVTEDLIGKMLETAPFGDPDLLIRTSGENRVSNFLLWESAYTEFYTTDVPWPEFTRKDLEDALSVFSGRSRRKGGGI
jgi:undecaprenyl diphosphate synthase